MPESVSAGLVSLMTTTCKDLNAWQYDPSMVPEFVEEPDGFYTQRIVPGEIKAVWFASEAEANHTVEYMPWSLEPCKIPKTKTTLKWKESWEHHD